MRTHAVRDVFTPARPARVTFVERQALNDALVGALDTPGKQLVVYGHSGSGKTTLLVNKLHQLYEKHITTRCVTGLSFDQIVLNAFDQFGAFFEAEHSATRKRQLSGGLETTYAGIKAQIAAAHSSERTTKHQRILPPQLTPQNLANFLGASKCCWVVEDFHKIDSGEKPKLAQVMKVFMDMADEYPELKIIALGAVGTAREVVAYDPEMRNRVSEIYVPLMSDAELTQIVIKGEKLLNISIEPNVAKGIVE